LVNSARRISAPRIIQPAQSDPVPTMTSRNTLPGRSGHALRPMRSL
jgi:hypothetical protein